MDQPRIECHGFKVGKVEMPKFEATVGQFLCIHWPLPSGSLEEQYLFEILLGTRVEPRLQVFGKIVRIAPLYGEKWKFSHLFARQTVRKFLIGSAQMRVTQVDDLLKRLDISPKSSINSISLTSKTLLGLEIAWINFPEIIIFETVGLDPLGIKALCQAISERLEKCIAIRFSYPTIPMRFCCSQTRCLEVKSEAM